MSFHSASICRQEYFEESTGKFQNSDPRRSMDEKQEQPRLKPELTTPTFGGHPSKEFLSVFEQLDRSINGELLERAWRHYDTIRQQVMLEVGLRKFLAMLTRFSGQPEGMDGVRVLHNRLEFYAHRSARARLSVLRLEAAQDLQLEVLQS